MNNRNVFLKNIFLLRFFLIFYLLLIIHCVYVLFFLKHLLTLHTLGNVLLICSVVFVFILTNLNYYLIFFCLLIEIVQNYFNNGLLNEEILIVIKLCLYGAICYFTFRIGEKVMLPLPKKISYIIATIISILTVIITILIALKR